MIYRLQISDTRDKYGGHGRKSHEIMFEGPGHRECFAGINALISEKYSMPSVPAAPIRMRGRRRFDPIPLYQVERRGRR